MNAATCTEEDWAKRDKDYHMRLNLIASPLIQEYLEAKSDTTSIEDEDQDGDIDMLHAEKESVVSNEPGNSADKKDGAEVIQD